MTIDKVTHPWKRLLKETSCIYRLYLNQLYWCFFLNICTSTAIIICLMHQLDLVYDYLPNSLLRFDFVAIGVM
jgi:hypothetical protein